MPYDNAPDASALDEVLLDVATMIELSPRDREITDNRYRRLKTHLEREGGALAAYLIDGQSRIYAQGSIATSTTIVSGTEDDRFDIDAIVEFNVPPDWSPEKTLDKLEEALQGFPSALKIVRCTRCVQIQFAFMHMDVAVLDRSASIVGEWPGDIFHSPDEGGGHRVPSNPWGFTAWFRGSITPGRPDFPDRLNKRRSETAVSRLTFLDEAEERMTVLAKAHQVDLPPMIPNRIDAEEAVALKLLKRFINLRYESSANRRPPSIYLTKKTGDLGYLGAGLTGQLIGLASSISNELKQHLAQGTWPCEENPSYTADKINDRWPQKSEQGSADMRAAARHLDHLVTRLAEAVTAQTHVVVSIIDDLFGERVGNRERQILKDRYSSTNSASSVLIKPSTGQVFAPALVVATEGLRQAPRHNFHCGVV